MTIAERMKRRHEKEKAKANVKTCILCEQEKDLSEFSKKRNQCKLCISRRRITCECGCHKVGTEAEMIYDVANDMYFLSQECADKKWGIVR